jgi:hypothetical protein
MLEPERQILAHMRAGSFQTARIKNEWGNCAAYEREPIRLPECVFLYNKKGLCS